MLVLGNARRKTQHEVYALVAIGRRMGNTLKRLWQDGEGQDLVEYALVAALIGLASVLALQSAWPGW